MRVCSVNSNLVALDGSVTLNTITPTVTGIFELVLGRFDALPCTAP